MIAARIAMLAALAVAALFAPPSAGAHGRSVSYSTWRVDGQRIDVTVRVAALDFSVLDDSGLVVDTPAAVEPRDAWAPDAPAAAEMRAALDTRRRGNDPLAAYVLRTVIAHADGSACRPAGVPGGTDSNDGWRSIAWTLECPRADAYTARVDVLFDELPGHVHFARIDVAGAASVERLITGERRTWTFQAVRAASRDTARGSSLGEYVALGIEHILSGYDHVAFLVALLLLATTLGEVVRVVSSFTVAHSLTLALAALGLAHPNAAAIEALIGFSIALVAIENAWLLARRPRFVPVVLIAALVALASAAYAGFGILRPVVFLGLALFCASHFSLMTRVRDGARLRVVVAFCFGLAHGFGFAGVLADIAADSGHVVHALLGFNAGVELGQLAIVAAVWPLLLLAGRTRAGAPRVLIAEVGSAVVCGLGTFWFLVRALG